MLKYGKNFQKKLWKDLYYFATNRLEILYVVHQVWIFIPSNYVDIKIFDTFKDCFYLQYCILFLLCSFESKAKSKSQNQSTISYCILCILRVGVRPIYGLTPPTRSWTTNHIVFLLLKKPPIWIFESSTFLHLRENY